MKFTKRQIKILGIASFVALLVLPVSFIFVSNLGKEKLRTIDAPDNLDLINAINSNISSLQTLQIQYSISDRGLTNRLKMLDTSFTKNDWRDYFREETKISELDNKSNFLSQVIIG